MALDSRHDATDLPLSPAWKLAGRNLQEPPRSALISWNNEGTGTAQAPAATTPSNKTGGTTAGLEVGGLGGLGQVAGGKDRWIEPIAGGEPVQLRPAASLGSTAKWREEGRDTKPAHLNARPNGDRWAPTADDVTAQRPRPALDARPGKWWSYSQPQSRAAASSPKTSLGTSLEYLLTCDAADRGLGAGEGTLGAGRGRAAAHDRWGPSNKDWIPGLPGMGAEPLEKSRLERWGSEALSNGGSFTTRNDNWRAPGGGPNVTPGGVGRGFVAGRGKPLGGLGTPGAPGRWSIDRDANGGDDVNGSAYGDHAGSHHSSMGGGHASASKRYTVDQLRDIGQQLVSQGAKLMMPAGASLPDYTDLVAPDGDSLQRVLSGDASAYPDQHIERRPLELFRQGTGYMSGALGEPASRMTSAISTNMGELSLADHSGNNNGHPTNPSNNGHSAAPPGMGGNPNKPLVATFSPAAHAADQWLYRDPQGVVQGPFSKKDILEWQAAGYFMDELPVRSAVDSSTDVWYPLAAVLLGWKEWEEKKQRLAQGPPGINYPQPIPLLSATQPEPTLHDRLASQAGFGGGLGNGPSAPLGGIDLAADSAIAAMRTASLQDPRTALFGQGGQPGWGGLPGGLGLGGGLLGGPGPYPGMGHPGYPGPGQAGLLGPSVLNPHGPPNPVLGGGLWEQGYGQRPGPQDNQPPLMNSLAQPNTSAWAASSVNEPLVGQDQLPQHNYEQNRTPAVAAAWGAQSLAYPNAATQAATTEHAVAKTTTESQLQPAAPPAHDVSAASQTQQAAVQQQAQQSQQAVQPAAPLQKPLHTVPTPQPQPAVPTHTQQQQQQDAVEQQYEKENAAASKLAPWAGTKAAVPGKTLKQIQEEEAAAAAAKAAAEAARLASESVPAPPPTVAAAPAAPPAAASGVWNKPPAPPAIPAINPTLEATLARGVAPAAQPAAAPAAAAPPPAPTRTTKAVIPAQPAAPPPVVGTGPGPRPTTLLDIFDKKLPGAAQAPPPAWGGAAHRNQPIPSLRDVINFEECAADWEGGALDEDLSDLLPPRPIPAPPARAAAAAVPEEQLFWDYGNTQQPQAPPPPPVRNPAPIPAAGQTLAARLAAATAAAQAPAAPAQKPVATPRGTTAAVAAAATPANNGPAAAPDAGASSNTTASQFSPEFWAWCRTAWAGFKQSEITLLEWLTTLQCRGEIADYINQIIGDQPGAGTFVAEFLRRKDAETARLANPGKKKKGNGQANQQGGDWQAAAKQQPATKKGGAKNAAAVAGGKKGGKGNGFAVLGMH